MSESADIADEAQNAQPDSSDLLARARAGDGESFGLLCEPLKDRLLRQAFALCRDQSQAQDLAQETLVEAWKSIARFDGRCRFSTWLCGILLHRHKNALRKARWRAVLAPFSSGDQDQSLHQMRDERPAPDIAAELSDCTKLVLQSLDRLPARQREIVFLRFYAGESLAEIAALVNCSLGTVKSRLFHALENLRKMNVFRERF